MASYDLWHPRIPRLEIYGLESVLLTDRKEQADNDSTIVERYKTRHPGQPFDLQSVVKSYVAKDLFVNPSMSGNVTMPLLPKQDVRWFTLEDYGQQHFDGELSEWD